MKRKVQIRKIRSYSVGFKKKIVSDYESGKFSVLQLEKLHRISNVSIYKWIYKFSTFNQEGYRIVEMKESSAQRMKDQSSRIKELERLVGQKQIQIEYYEKVLELAKEEYDIDLKKNFDTPQSPGSGNTKKK
jgi:transposase